MSSEALVDQVSDHCADLLAATSFADDGVSLPHRFVAVRSTSWNRPSQVDVDPSLHLIFIALRHGRIVECSASPVCHNDRVNCRFSHDGRTERDG